MDVGVLGGGETEQQDTGDKGRGGHGTLTTEVGQVDQDPGEEGTGDTADCGDGVITVGLVGGGGVGTQVLGKEGVEKGISQSDASPAQPE